MILYKDLPYYSYFRFDHVLMDRYAVKIFHDQFEILSESPFVQVHAVFVYLIEPRIHDRFSRSLFDLVRSDPVYAFHHEVSVESSVYKRKRESRSDRESRVSFKSDHVERDNRYLFHSKIFECLSEQCNVVACPASSACL